MSRTSWSLLFSSFIVLKDCLLWLFLNCKVSLFDGQKQLQNSQVIWWIFMFFSFWLWQFTPSLLWIHVKYAPTPLVLAVWTEASICQTPKHLNHRALEDHPHGNSSFLCMSHPWPPQNMSHHQRSKPVYREVQHCGRVIWLPHFNIFSNVYRPFFLEF